MPIHDFIASTFAACAAPPASSVVACNDHDAISSTFREVGAPLIGDIARAVSGLLGWFVGGSGTREFQAADWQVRGQSANGFGVGAYGIAYSGPAFNLHNVLRWLVPADRDTMLVQAVVYGTTANGAMRSVGAAARAKDTGNTGTSKVTYIGHRLPVGSAGAAHGVAEYEDSVEQFTGGVATFPLDVGRRSSVWCNPASMAAYDHTSDSEFSAGVSTPGLGKPGVAFWDEVGGGQGQVICAEFIATAGRYVHVSGAGLVDGYVCKVRKLDGTVIAQAVVAAGVADIDLWKIVLDGTLHNLAVYDALGNLLGSFAPGGDGVMPGDEFTVAA